MIDKISIMRTKSIAWTEREDEILKEKYGKIKNKELSILLNKTECAVTQRAFKIKVNCINYHDWTDSDLETLKTSYVSDPKKIVLEKLPKYTWSKIKAKATKCGIKRRTEHMDQILADLSILLNESNETAYWIGFLLADGHFSKTNRLQFALHPRDKESVFSLSKYLNFAGKFRKTSKSIGISIMDGFNIPLIKNKYDIHHQKTYYPPKLEVFDNMSDNFFFSMLVGFIDGDGTIQNRKITKVKYLGIKLHSSWLSALSLFLKRISKAVGINLTEPYIDSRGYAQGYVTNNIHIKFLKGKAIELNIPFMKRKWDKIDENFLSKQEEGQFFQNEIIKLLINGVRTKDICRPLGAHPSVISKYKKELLLIAT